METVKEYEYKQLIEDILFFTEDKELREWIIRKLDHIENQ